jgi:hypothetical protein
MTIRQGIASDQPQYLSSNKGNKGNKRKHLAPMFLSQTRKTRTDKYRFAK